jgi:hypothetical protein
MRASTATMVNKRSGLNRTLGYEVQPNGAVTFGTPTTAKQPPVDPGSEQYALAGALKRWGGPFRAIDAERVGRILHQSVRNSLEGRDAKTTVSHPWSVDS